ncbi:serine hydrolase domain-containing protein [Paracerasibacillus soli]|uniref:serine hydrolase domain-containing protein n=1 Tax=Paracerasibacillus soli TaxID=480284 RepID=UPI00387E1C60
MGSKSVFPNELSMTLDTVFDLASLTKVVATLPAILKLIENGELRLDDSVAFFLPEFRKHGKEHISMRHLLTHTSGLPAHRQYYLNHLSTTEIVDSIYEQELAYPVGEKVVYSDLGFIILYKVIEKITGVAFEDYVRREIFKPLGMLETGFNPSFPTERYAATEYSDKLQAYKCGLFMMIIPNQWAGLAGMQAYFLLSGI